MRFGVRPLPGFLSYAWRSKQLYFRKCCKDYINDNTATALRYWTYYFTHCDECWTYYLIQFSKQPKKVETWPPSFIKRNVTSEGLGLMTAPLFSAGKTDWHKEWRKRTRWRERGLKDEKADTLQRGLCRFHAESAEWSSYLCPETMAAFASSSVKNTKDRNEMWELLVSMSTGRREVPQNSECPI